MKRITAMAMAAAAGSLLAAPASAQGEAETMMVLGGYTNYTFSITKFPGTAEEQDGNIEIFNNTEIFFNGSAETDGGLQVSARVELEGGTQGDQIDEHYMRVSGDFGSFEIGANDGADEQTAAGIFYNSSAVDYYYWNGMTVPNQLYWGPGTFNDGMGIVYTTPSFGGAKIAVGYKPTREAEQNADSASGDDQILTAGIKWSGDLGGTPISASAGWGDDDLGYTKWGIGLSVGIFEGLTFHFRHDDESSSPSFSETWLNDMGTDDASDMNTDDETNLLTGLFNEDFVSTAVAVSGQVGALTWAIGYAQAKRERDVITAGVVLNDDGEIPQTPIGTPAASSSFSYEVEDKILIGSVDYSLGSGVTATAYVATGSSENTNVVTGGVTGDDYSRVSDAPTNVDESGTAFGVALNLAF